MSEDPTAILPVLDGREEKVYVRPDPAIERVAVFAEMFGSRITDHVFV